jgi:glucosamine--fructose-6-phosphate aminotransferase (isomerizing)
MDFALEKILGDEWIRAFVQGIAHTRWANSWRAFRFNAHPIPIARERSGCAQCIIENFDVMRIDLEKKGQISCRLPDTEVIAHLIEDHYSGELFQRKAYFGGS